MSFPGALMRGAAKALSAAVNRTGRLAQSYLEGYRRGDCLSRMGWAHHGAPRAQADRVACNLFGGADFWKRPFAGSLRKIGGTENPEGDPLALGVVCAMSERKVVAVAWTHTIAPPRGFK